MNLNHKATVDAHGNIILPVASTKTPDAKRVEMTMEEGVWYSAAPEKKEIEQPWTREVEEDVQEEKIASAVINREEPSWTIVEETSEHIRNNVLEQFRQTTTDVLQEGIRQYSTSLYDSKRVGKESLASLTVGLKHAWQFLRQPVWIPGKRDEPKQYSRGALFFFDTLRFGGTFASLFLLLFVTLNYQSFWAIAQSYVDPLAQVTGASQQNALDKEMADKLKRIPALATAGQSDGGMLAFLPPVGPPDNRLIIPKLDLNVPIVVPSNTPLMNEDWKGLEDEIQAGLQNGVVHYPGTAKPGQAGNFFVTGHSSYFPWDPGKYKSVFARLSNLNVGDEYWVFYGGDRFRYVIQEKKEIKPSDVTVLDQPVNKRISTLMTCTPVGTTLRRLIIVSQEVDPVTGSPLEVGDHGHEDTLPQAKMDMLSI
jgi:LPXTG-site transpeptidase (sortase) family protein